MTLNKIGAVAFAALLAFTTTVQAQHPAPTNVAVLPDPGMGGWRSDLDHLVSAIETLHPNPFGRRNEAAFREDVAVLRANMGAMNREQIVVAIMRIVASLEDGHTSISPDALRSLGFHILPLRLHEAPEGLILTGADRVYGEWLGARLISINGMRAAEVRTRVATMIPHDNEQTIAGRLPEYLIIPELLAGLGVIHSASEPIRLVFEREGRQGEVSVEPISMPPMGMGSGFADAYTADWLDAAPAARPLWLRNMDRAYWMEHLPGSNTLYVAYNRADSEAAEPMGSFARRMRAAIDEHAVDRVVLDLRHNTGGEAFWSRILMLALVRSDRIEPRGKLFVLIGRDTFSAGTLMAIDMQRYTSAVLVGEPTAGALINYGNHEPVTLPASGLMAMVATKFYQNNGPNDLRRAVEPELSAELTAADYVNGRDPLMTAVLNYRPIGEVMREALGTASLENALAAYQAIKDRPEYRYLDGDAALNAAGYALLRAGDVERATIAFTAQTQAFPHSANAFDSLGDAHKAAGRRDEAITAYRRALAIAPGWVSARHSLAELGAEPSSP